MIKKPLYALLLKKFQDNSVSPFLSLSVSAKGRERR